MTNEEEWENASPTAKHMVTMALLAQAMKQIDEAPIRPRKFYRLPTHSTPREQPTDLLSHQWPSDRSPAQEGGGDG